ncbi:DUF6271 family protein [Streptomyces aurantiacus]|uniref:Glycosyltransferase family 2 protein n=1 Tax=Streptomyces aurantiacus TaxID=47760 RepID=A0A7G1NRW8_9ACTN|nr:DUF6271 family protein [Streptomyces aurantiacus]BCL25211.1 hypothetical protein GCM10017557_00700 [Streptomyces aurantiacus]
MTPTVTRTGGVDRICLALPTNRACSAAISALADEAAYATRHFGVEVHLLILDSSDEATRSDHARVTAALPVNPDVIVHHLDEQRQRDVLRRLIRHAGLAAPALFLDLLLPDAVSYGACTNRAFLIAGALGCRSVHRRDSDSAYQTLDGEPVFPIHHELASLGRPATEVSAEVSATTLDLTHAHAQRPVSMVGASFIGELSVDIDEIRRLDESIYHDVVSLWAPGHWPEEQKRQLVEESFKGAGTDRFTQDHSVLTLVDPMRVDMCNISFRHEVYERVPLPPATSTIGSDYFLIHLVHDAALPGVLHNRDIENFYTPERRTDAGFMAYQTRFVKFLLSMLYFNFVYDGMAAAGPALLDDQQKIRPETVVDLLRASTGLDRTENLWRLESVGISYRKLGGRYEEFADRLTARRDQLLDEAARDMEDFALLTEAWGPLMRAARDHGIGSAAE